MKEIDWEAKVEKLKKELAEAKQEIRSLRLLGDVLEHALWPHEELEVSFDIGTQKAPPIVAFWREFKASKVEGEKR